MASFLLVDLKISPDSSVRELDAIFPGAGAEVLAYLQNLSRDLQGASKDAFLTKVPFYTGELRNAQIIDKDKSTKTKPGFTVFVIDTKHTSTYGRRKPTGAELAEILDVGISEKNGAPLHRRKNAVPAFNKLTSLVAPSKGSPTKGWVDSALAAIEKAIDDIG